MLHAVPHDAPAPPAAGDRPQLDPERLADPVAAQLTTFLHVPGSLELEDHIVHEMSQRFPGVLPPPEAIRPGTGATPGGDAGERHRITPQAWENLRSLRRLLIPSQLRGAGAMLLEGTYRITLDAPRLPLLGERTYEILIKAEPARGDHLGSRKSTAKAASTRTTGEDKSVTRGYKHAVNISGTLRHPQTESDTLRGFTAAGLDVTPDNPSHGVTTGFETEVTRTFSLESETDVYAHPVTYQVLIGVQDPEHPTTRLSTAEQPPSPTRHTGQVEPGGRLTVEVARESRTTGTAPPAGLPGLDMLPQRHAIRHVTDGDGFRDKALQSLASAFEKRSVEATDATTLQRAVRAVRWATGFDGVRDGTPPPAVRGLRKALDGMADDGHLRSLLSASHGGWANSGDEQVGSGRNRDTIGLSARTRLSNFRFRRTMPGEGKLEIETTSSTSTAVADKNSRALKLGVGHDTAHYPSAGDAAESFQPRGGPRIKGGSGWSDGDNVKQKTTTSRKTAHQGTWHLYEADADVTVQGRVTAWDGAVTVGDPESSRHRVLVLLSDDDVRRLGTEGTADTGAPARTAPANPTGSRRAPLLEQGLLSGAIAHIPSSDEILGEIDRQIRGLKEAADVPVSALEFAGTFSPENLSANYEELVGQGIFEYRVQESHASRLVTRVLVRGVPQHEWTDEGDHSAGDTTRKVGLSQTVTGSSGRNWSGGLDTNSRLSYAPIAKSGSDGSPADDPPPVFRSWGWAPSLGAEFSPSSSADAGVTTKVEYKTSKFGDMVRFANRMRFEVTVTRRTVYPLLGERPGDLVAPRLVVEPAWPVHVYVPTSLTEHRQAWAMQSGTTTGTPVGTAPVTADRAERDRWQRSLDSAHDLVGFDSQGALLGDAETLLTTPRPRTGGIRNLLGAVSEWVTSAFSTVPATVTPDQEAAGTDGYRLVATPRQGHDTTTTSRGPGDPDGYRPVATPRQGGNTGHGQTVPSLRYWPEGITLEAAHSVVRSVASGPRPEGSTNPLLREQRLTPEQQAALRQALSQQTLASVFHQLKDPATGYRTIPLGSDGRTGLELRLRPTGEAQELSTRDEGSDEITVSTEHESSTTSTAGVTAALKPATSHVFLAERTTDGNGSTVIVPLPSDVAKVEYDATSEGKEPVTLSPGVPSRTLTPPTVPHGKAADEPGKATLKGAQVLMRQPVRLTTQNFDENGTYGNTADTDGHVYYWVARTTGEAAAGSTSTDGTSEAPAPAPAPAPAHSPSTPTPEPTPESNEHDPTQPTEPAAAEPQQTDQTHPTTPNTPTTPHPDPIPTPEPEPESNDTPTTPPPTESNEHDPTQPTEPAAAEPQQTDQTHPTTPNTPTTPHPDPTPEPTPTPEPEPESNDTPTTPPPTESNEHDPTQPTEPAAAEPQQTDQTHPTTPNTPTTPHPDPIPTPEPEPESNDTPTTPPPTRKRRAEEPAGPDATAKRPRTPRHENTDAVLRDRGLVPPSPEEHQRVRERAAELGVFAAPHQPLLSAITRGFTGPNCGETVEAYRDTWFGRPRAAGFPASGADRAGPERGFAWTVYKRHDMPLSYGQGPAGFDAVLDLVTRGGPGSFATVLAGDHGSVGHDWALVHTGDGALLWVDVHGGTVHPAEPGRPPAGLPPHVRIWASAADRHEGRLTGTGTDDPYLLSPDSEHPEARFGMSSDVEMEEVPTAHATPPDADVPGSTRQRFADLTLDDRRVNEAYRRLTSRTRGDFPTDEDHRYYVRRTAGRQSDGDYLDYVRDSVEQARPLAFVVNTMTGHGDAHRAAEVIESLLSGLDGYDGRLAIVIGVNANETQGQALAKAVDSLERQVENLDVPVAVVPSTFTGPFPYGTMRNAVLHSPENIAAVRSMMGLGLHPYIAVQDFDDGSRTVPSGLHVFTHFEQLLDPPGLRSTDPDEALPPSRPLLMTGGYRVPGPEEGEQQKRLIEDTKRRYEQKNGTVPEQLTNPVEQRAFLERFRRAVADDMRERRFQARIHPLLPYAPEPNLFVDGATVLPHPAGGGSDRPDVRFSDKGAELTGLARQLNRYNAWELGRRYDRELAELDGRSFEVPPSRAAEDTHMTLPVGADEVVERVRADAENHRLPFRGPAYVTDFESGAVVTDLSRIAYEFLESEGKKLLQSHADLGTVTNRFFSNDNGGSTRGAKKGISLATHRSNYAFHNSATYWSHEPRRAEISGIPTGSKELPTKSRGNLGHAKRNVMADAISAPMTGSFAGLKVGVPDTHKVWAAQELALSTPVLRAGRRLADLLFGTGSEGGPGDDGARLRTAVSRLDAFPTRSGSGPSGQDIPADGDCLYHAVNRALSGIAPSGEAALELRASVVRWTLAPENLGTAVRYADEHGEDFDDVVNVLAVSGNWNEGAGDLAPRLVASALDVVIRIHQAGGQVHELLPLGAATADGLLVIDLSLNGGHYEVHQVERRPFLTKRSSEDIQPGDVPPLKRTRP
ncbi:toxin glutamine deamidase domain-containing protein [Streptomyces sp. I6]|uniref:toxin glutamine deamidase domain-containing protein n=1 Tax=Streptomyces sp. I6 TaxID=2483113 RepID=UPI000F4474D4|nr:toxin glutamine deamidase domain-containing protein [Streptomyces sp. I6]RNL73523.1 hypothetical protein EBF04_26505 [Streptomyces sp. I6]